MNINNDRKYTSIPFKQVYHKNPSADIWLGKGLHYSPERETYHKFKEVRKCAYSITIVIR
jgi:hypothetical protein